MRDIRICPRCHQMNPTDVTHCETCGASLADARVTHPAIRENEVEFAMMVDAEGVVRTMECPLCDVPMHRGEAFIRFPKMRWSWSVLAAELAFRLRDRRGHAAVLDYGEDRRAARCPSCRGVWIGSRPEYRS